MRNNSSNRPPEPSTKYEDKNGAPKKSKKEKRNEKGRERSSTSDGKKEKDSKQSSTSILPPPAKQKEEKHPAKSMEKMNGTSKREKDISSGSNTPKDSKQNRKYKFDTKIDSPHDGPSKNADSIPAAGKKPADKLEKDNSDRKQRHKKKDKNKEKDRSGSKERRKEKEKLSKGAVKELIDDANHKRSAQTPPIPAPSEPTATSGTKAIALPGVSLSEDSSMDFDSDYVTRGPTSPPAHRPHSSNTIRGEPHENDHTDIITKRSPSVRGDNVDSPSSRSGKKSGKVSKDSINEPIKDDKKRKRKSKSDKRKQTADSTTTSKRKTQSPAVIDEPPPKYSRKDEIIAQTTGRPSQTPPPSFDHHNHTNSHLQSDSITSNSSIPLPNLSNDSTSFRSPIEPATVDYISQLRTLQHRIMSLQNNSELQQVVDMIAATGCYEITSRTFDFDLCALDRTTVQRLQDFLSQSTVL